MKRIFLVALAGLLCLACDRAEVISVEMTGSSVDNDACPETRAHGSQMTPGQCIDRLMSKTWVLTEVKRNGVVVDDTAIGNKVAFHINEEEDQTLFFDCSEHRGWTYDHTWEKRWIVSNLYGDTRDARWSVYSYDNSNWLEIEDGYLVVFVQDSLTGVYQITSMSTNSFTVQTTGDDKTWTLKFQAMSFPPAGYEIAWRDEFNGHSISSAWEFESGGDWGGEEEEKELQYYCPDGIYTPTGQNTAYVSGGSLKIKAYKITPSQSSEWQEYISARMQTKPRRYRWQYGYIEMRAKLPTTAGCWPAFWMLQADGNPDVTDDSDPTGGEIDIMEYVPNEDEHQVFFSAHSYNANATDHWSTYEEPETGALYSYCQSSYLYDPASWHTYSMLWTDQYILGFRDGVEYFYVPNPTPDVPDLATWPFDKKYYLKLNLAIGGSWGGDPDPDFTSATYEIDWVRVYQTH